MAKEAFHIISNDDVIKTLASSLHIGICRLQSAIIKKNEHAVGEHVEAAIEQSYELLNRVNRLTE